MIKLTAIGTIYFISPLINVTDTFAKRELVIDDTWTGKDGTQHPNYVKIEFTGERMNILDQFAPGQRVTVDACVNGRPSKNGDIFNTIKGLNVMPYQQPQYQQPQQYAPQPSYPQPQYQAPQPYQQTQYQAPMQTAQPSAPYPQGVMPNQGVGKLPQGADELPF